MLSQQQADKRVASSAVISACLKDEHIPLMGTALFCEYEDVLCPDVYASLCILVLTIIKFNIE